MAKVRETIASRVEAADAEPIDPMLMVSKGAMTVDDAIAFTGIKKSNMEAHINAGRLPVVRDGRARKVPRYALELFMARRLAFRRDGVIIPVDPDRAVPRARKARA